MESLPEVLGGGMEGSQKAAATSEPSRNEASQVPTPANVSFSLACSGTRFSPGDQCHEIIFSCSELNQSSPVSP